MKKFFPWPGTIVLFILGNMAVCGVTVAVAMRAGDRGVEPDYYQKAKHWDESVAAKERSDKLGWRVLYLEPPTVGRALRVRVIDINGNGVEGAKVNLEAFHHATASKRIEMVLTSDAKTGVAAADFAPDRAGLWEFRWTVDAPAGRFGHDESVDVQPAGTPIAQGGGVW